ncbi:hypothetical protein JCM6882_009469 [Rhodosporidiobolus microsporus]
MEPPTAPSAALAVLPPDPSSSTSLDAQRPQSAGRAQQDAKEKEQEGVDTTADLIAGWLGGAVGVVVGNPFEVLKVRLQTLSSHGSSSSSHSHSSPRVGKSSVPPLPSPAFPFPPPPAPIPSASPATFPVVSSPAPHSASSLSTPAPAAPPPSTEKTKQGAPPKTEKPQRVGLLSLYRTEGFRFFFAGTAGPILGLAFIDSAFFGLYGRVMQTLGQDRQDPNSLTRVFLSGATAGALCACLETPIEVVKTRAQVESVPGKKLGSFRIASQIAKTEGLKGFYIGGLMTAIHDGVSSGIFFSTYFVLRRLLRGESPFHAAPASLSTPLESLASPLPVSPASSPSVSSSSSFASDSSASAPAFASPAADTPSSARAAAAAVPDSPYQEEKGGMGKGEVFRILLAGGLAGALSAVVPYPFDIVKTRLQTANFASRARSSPVTTATSTFTANTTPFHTSRSSAPSSSGAATAPPPKLTVPAVFRGIHADGAAAYRYTYPTTWVYQFLARYVFPTSSSRVPPASLSVANPHANGAVKGVLNPKAEKWALRLLGLKGFKTGIGPTVVSSFVGSAATITTVELALHFMGVNGGGGGIG